MKPTLPNFLAALLSKITSFKNLSILVVVLLFSGGAWGQSTANYAFTTNATGSLALLADGSTAVDMTTGTNQLVAASSDQGVSAVTNIGFDFYLMGAKFTQFSTSANGVLKLGSSAVTSTTYVTSGGTTSAPVISAFAGDLQTGSSGKIHYKVIGSAPNRCLVVEYLNMNLYYVSTVYGNDATFQVRLYETSGVLEFVYGTVAVSSITGSPSDYSPSIGFSTGTAANLFAFVTISSNTATTTGTFTDNPNSAVGPIANLTSSANGSRRVYKFTPPQQILAAPTSLNFTSITSNGMTLNWSAASPTTGIGGYAVYYSSDSGVTYILANTTVLGTNTLAVTGLTNFTNYLWNVYSISEAVWSTALSGSQTTSFGSSTPGNATYTVPVGVCSITVETWGAGGGGGGALAPSSSTGGGGGGGAYSKDTFTVVPGTIYNFTVGVAGTAGAGSASVAGTGGSTYFGNSSTGNTSGATVLAVGGTGGTGTTTTTGGAGGAGGLASSGTGSTKFSGGYGGNGNGITAPGAGGGSAGSGANGNFTATTTGSTGTVAPVAVTGGVAGIAGPTSSNSVGVTGNAGGGGGSGAWARNSGTGTKTGGVGGVGKILITVNTVVTGTSAAPIVSSICNGATSISGTSTEVDGTIIELFSGVVSLGTTTVTSNAWTKSGLTALITGASITAKAATCGKLNSTASTAITVMALSATPTLTSPICNAATSISGSSSEADGTTITVYKGGVSQGTTTVTSGAWSLTGLSSIATNDIITAKATATGKCESEVSTSVTVNACSDPLLTAGTLASFGNQCTTTTSSPNSFTISAINLTTADLTIASLSGYSFCLTSGGSYTSSLTISQPGGTLASTLLYVKFTPIAVQSYNGDVVISGGGLAANVSVAASGTGINNLAGLSHTTQLVSYCTGSVITSNTATLATTGGTVTYSVSPTLPTGLSLNTNTGAITGTPTVATAATDYVVTANNGCSTTTSTVNITVLTPMSGLTYTLTSATYCAGASITANAVTAIIGGGTIAYSVSPALPAGLALNTSTGEITGIPSVATASATYTVTASNGACSTTKALTIVVSATLNGTYTVGSGGNYATLTAAVTAYNSACLTGPVVFSLTDATYSTSETFPITINANGTANSDNTLIIRPASGVTTSISGAIPSNALIKITAKYVTIDGSNTNGGTTRNLTITNTSTTSPYIIIIGNSGTSTATALTNVTLKNTILINGVNTGYAVLIANNSAAAGYFNNITIQNNSVQKAYMGIYALATAATGNGSGLFITGNDLNSSGANAISYTGIYVQGVDGATVSNNNIGNITSSTVSPRGIWFATATNSGSISGNTISTLSYTGTSAFAPSGIHITSGSTATAISASNNTISGLTSSGIGSTNGIYTITLNSSIFNNKISNIKNTNSGGFYANGIYLASSSTTAAISVYNNFIFDIAAYGWPTASDNGFGIGLYSGGGYNLYNNTINMNTNQTTGVSSAIYIYSSLVTAASVNIQNNIFANTQTAGATAANRYAIYSDAANTIFGTINHNDYYSTGTNLGYLGSARTNVAGIVTGFGGNANSISALPNFTSSTDLHLTAVATASGNAALKAGTYISSVLTDYDGDTRNVTVPAIGADEIFINGFWTGATSTVWNGTETGNWDDGTLPASGADIVVPAGVTNSPVITGISPTIGKLNLGTGKTLTLGANTLTINGAVSGSGTITGGSTSNLTIGGTAGTLNFTTGNRSLNNLSLGASGSATLGTALDIYGTVGFTTGGSLNMNAQAVILKSTDTATARISDLTGSTLSGATNVTVERYIPNKRAWRALTAPLKGSNKSIFSQWQNGGSVSTGTGVELWGPGGTGSTGNGLAVGPNNSILQYNNSATGAWASVIDTKNTNLFTTGGNNAFMLFPTGGYGSNNIAGNTTAAATTLKATGELITGQVPYTNLPNTSHTLIGNPYASPIDLNSILDASTTLQKYFWVWDPNGSNQGAYNMFDALANTFSSTDLSYSNSTVIQSGQAFFVKALTGQTGSFTINENNKSNATVTNVFRNGTTPELFRVGLYKQENNLWSGRDGAMTVILSDADANQTPNKMANGTENVAFTKNGANFASNHHLPLVATDVLNVKVWNTTAGANYKLKINTEQFATTNLSATLEDLFTNARTPLTLDGSAVEYPFTVTTDALSSGDRFRIVFQTSTLGTTIPTATSFSIIPNPVTGDSFQVNLGTLATGSYSYSICNAIGQEVEKGSINTTTQNTNYTVKFRETAATGIYIMKIKGSDNSVFTAKLIKK